ncbi:MAG: hypothetical protein JSV14_02910, partial [Deltaproteobacteria bacterium]
MEELPRACPCGTFLKRFFFTRIFRENDPSSAFTAACCGVSERTPITWIHSLPFDDSLWLAAGSFKYPGYAANPRMV